MSGFARSSVSVFVLAAALVFAGCGGGGDAGEGASETAQSAETAPPPSRPAIPEDSGVGKASPEVTLRPFFDREGTQTEMAVAPGETFKLYVCARYPAGMMNAAQYRLVVPDGVEFVKQTEAYEKTLSMGEWDRNFAMVYPCREGEEMFYLMEYEFRTGTAFAGGEIWTAEGMMGEGEPFLGFASCDTQKPVHVAATRGSVTLDVK